MASEARHLHPQAEPLLDARLFPADFGNLTARVERLARKLAESAVERDRRGGHARTERELIRDSGLLSLAIPQRFDGQERSWPEIYRIVRHLAAADSSLAHLFAFNHLQVATILLHGSAEQQRHWLTRAVRERWFWGNATNGRDLGLSLAQREEHFELNGRKSFCSGALGSDALVVSAPRGSSTTERVFLVLPAQREGLAINDDWDAFGQRQTDSGTVRFDAVRLDDEELLQVPGQGPTPRATLRSQIAQLIMAQLYLGLAEGAFDEARRYTATRARPWSASGVARAVDDPLVQHRYGDLWLKVRAAQAVAADAVDLLRRALERGEALTAQERGEVALAVAEAKVLAHRAGVEVGSQLFELTGARSTAAEFGLDRFWRNARVHTLHDPVDYKLRDLGRFFLDGRIPDPTAYS